MSVSHREVVVAFTRGADGIEDELAPILAGSGWTARAIRVEYSQKSLDQLQQALERNLPTAVTLIAVDPLRNRVVVALADPTESVASDVIKRLPSDDRLCVDSKPNAVPLPK